jgi:hypothetical protein
MKHNKKRNTAFIYEALSRELTKAIVTKDSMQKHDVMAVIKEFFSKDTVLGKELSLYHNLLQTKNLPPHLAEKMLQETKKAHDKLNEENIFDTQSKIISAINKKLGQEVWANFIPNFKSLASVDAIFNSKTSVKKRVLFEQALVNMMTETPFQNNEETLSPIDSLAYKSFIEKFNNKYGALLQEQKDLLNQFITSFSDDGFELRVYLNEELSRLKICVANAMETATQPLISQKLEDVGSYLEEFRKRDFTDVDLKKVLKTQELVRELQANDQN